MTGLRQSMGVLQYRLRILSRNYKIYTLVVCMWIFLWNDMEALRGFMEAVSEKASPFLFPFLFTDEILTALIYTGVLLFYIEAPFYDKSQLFVVVRSTAARWILGHVFYVLVVSILYMCFLAVLSILVILPQSSLLSDWGKIWTTLGMTGAGYELGLPISVPDVVLYNYTPIQAFLLAFVLGSLICSFYGFAMWCFNLFFGKILSFLLILASVFLVTRIVYLPSWLMYLVPSAWANIGNLSEYANHGLSVGRCLVLLILGNISFAGIAFWKTLHIDLAK